jgi:hypothetical protein
VSVCACVCHSEVAECHQQAKSLMSSTKSETQFRINGKSSGRGYPKPIQVPPLTFTQRAAPPL